jgi:hypothetical protein
MIPLARHHSPNIRESQADESGGRLLATERGLR